MHKIEKFPKKLLEPVRKFLVSQKELLETKLESISDEDPFNDPERARESAAIDTDAQEHFAHATTLALKEQIEEKMAQTKKAIGRVKKGEYGICETCDNMINTDRLMIYPEATLCVKCGASNE